MMKQQDRWIVRITRTVLNNGDWRRPETGVTYLIVGDNWHFVEVAQAGAVSKYSCRAEAEDVILHFMRLGIDSYGLTQVCAVPDTKPGVAVRLPKPGTVYALKTDAARVVLITKSDCDSDYVAATDEDGDMSEYSADEWQKYVKNLRVVHTPGKAAN